MGATAKLALLMELKNKLFNEKLMDTKKKLQGSVNKMRGSIDKLKSSHIKAFKAMRDEIPMFGRAMDLLGNPYALMLAGAVSLALVFGKGVSEAKKFNHEFLQIKQLNLDKSSKQLSDYKESIRDAAFEVGTNLQESAKAFYDLQSATGVYGNDAVEIFKKVGRYSIATGAELGDSINATTKAMKAFGLGVNDIDSYLSSNAKTVQVGITTFKELAQVQTEYAGAAAGAGQSVDSANKLFAAFTSIAKDSNTAATMTKTAFQGLTQASTVKSFKQLGVRMYDANGKMLDLHEILIQVSDKFKKMSPKAIDKFINKVGGPEGLNAMLTKLKTDSVDLFNTFYAFDTSSFSLGDALKNAKGDITVLGGIVKNRFNIVMSKLGEVILPLVAHALNFINSIIVGAVNTYTGFTNWITGGSLAAEIFKGAMIGLAAAITLTNLPLILMAGQIMIVKTATAIWTGVQWLLNVALTANPIGIIIVAIGALIGAIVYIVKKTEGWAQSWIALKEIAKVVWSQMVTNFYFLVDSIKYGVEKVWLKFKNVGQHIIGFAEKVKEAVKLAWEGNFSAARDKMKEEIVTEADKQLEALEANRKKQIDSFKKETIDNEKKVLELSKGISLKWKKGDPEGEKSDGLLTTSNGNSTENGDSESLGSLAGSQIGDVSDKAGAAKNISISIDSFVKGGINTSNTTLSSMNKQEIEQWLQETFLRMVRAADMM